MTLLALPVAWLADVYLALLYDVPACALVLFLLVSVLLLFSLISLFRRFSLGRCCRLSCCSGPYESQPTATMVRRPCWGIIARRSVLREIEGSDSEPAGVVTRFRLGAERIKRSVQHGKWTEISGELLITVRESGGLVRARDRPYFRYGDRLPLQGRLDTPPELEGFDYPAYLDAQDIGSVMSFPTATLLAEGHGRSTIAGCTARAEASRTRLPLRWRRPGPHWLRSCSWGFDTTCPMT